MGFRPEPTVFNLHFKDAWLNGLEVKIGCCSVGEFNSILATNPTTGEEVAAGNTRVLKLFLKYLVEWNLESNVDGEWVPTPHTVEGCETHERSLIRVMLMTWQGAMAGVDDDLGKDSMSGDSSLEQSLGLGGA